MSVVLSADYVVCNDDEVLCDSGLQCVPSSSICDGWMDCDDTSDEHGCSKSVALKLFGHHTITFSLVNKFCSSLC